MDRLLTYSMFVAVADGGSFAAAARARNQSPAAVTRGVAALEARLGVRLFHRSTRAVSLTAEGTGFLGEARRILADLAAAERTVIGARAEPAGQFYVTAPVMFGRLHVVPVVAELIDRHPALDVRMMLIDRNVRIVEEGIDVAVRIGPLADSALVAVRIGWVRETVVASPAYLARFGVPERPDDLADHRLIASSGPRARGVWQASPRSGRSHRPRLDVNSVAATVAAAEAGIGLANLLDYQVADALSAGRLVALPALTEAEPMPVSLLFEASRSRMASAHAFIDAMRARAAVSAWGRATG